MANQWFKFYGGEYLSDPKIERLSPLERSCWVTLLCLASMNGEGKIEFLTVETLLNKSGIQFDPYHPEEWEKALSVLVKFQNMRMIEMTEDGDILIKNWEKRQEHNLTVAERVAKHRAKKDNVTKNVTIDVTNVTTEENRIEENRRVGEAKASQPLKEEEATEQEYTLELDEETVPHKTWAKKKAQDAGYKGPQVTELMEWAKKEKGARFVDVLAQKKCIGGMLQAGFSTDEIKKAWNDLEKEEWVKGVDFKILVSQIGKAKKKPTNEVPSWMFK